MDKSLVKVGDVWRSGNVRRRVLVMYKLHNELFVGYLFEAPSGIKGCTDMSYSEFLKSGKLLIRPSKKDKENINKDRNEKHGSKRLRKSKKL